MKTAYLHSVETLGLVDGPGIRTVFFLQGCPLKCLYCHNPDTQNFMGKTLMTVEDVVSIALRYKSYYKASGGGVTFSGGEPLMQGAFLIEALKALKKEGIHTCIDTSGYGLPKYYDEILRYTDTLLLDVKQFTDAAHLYLTGRTMDGVVLFMNALDHYQGQIVIRHVMLPGVTDNESAMSALLETIRPIEKKVDKIEILPYHKAGSEKYSQLKESDPLFEMAAMDPKRCAILENWVNDQLKGRQVNAHSCDSVAVKIV